MTHNLSILDHARDTPTNELRHLPADYLSNIGRVRQGEKVECEAFESQEPFALNEDDFDDEPSCSRCDEYGQVVGCCDDMCRGLGNCIHGDGMILCPDCGGEGKL